jgi:hypothetical protein
MSRNYTFINYFLIIIKIALKPFSILLSLWIYPLFLYPCYHSLEYSLSHPHLYFRWPTQGITTTTTAGTTTERTTRLSTHCHPVRLLLSNYWLCKHKCFRLCSRPLSACRLLNLKRRHHRRGIDLEIFSALNRLPFLKLWSRWMLTIGSSLLKRSCKWCSATTMRRCC